MAGLYLGMASHLYLAIGGGVLGAAFFCTGFIAVLLTSAELFTGDALIFVAAVLGGKVSIRSLCRNWTISWICNMAGCLAWAYFMVYLPDSLEELDKNEYAIKVALAKANQPLGNHFSQGYWRQFHGVSRGLAVHLCRRSGGQGTGSVFPHHWFYDYATIALPTNFSSVSHYYCA